MSTLEESIKAYITKMANDPTSVWTTSPPKERPRNILEMIRSAKIKLVQSQRYDDAKDLRDIERLLMEKLGNEPVVLNDIEAILDDVRESKNSAARAEEGVGLIEQRIEKLEAALKEEQAKTAELDKLLSGTVKDVYVLKNPSPTFSAPADHWTKKYYQGADPQATFDANYGTAKMANDKPEAEVLFGDGYNMKFDYAASPSGIPFSVALEFMKAGRKVRRAGMGNGYIYAAVDSYGAFWGNEAPFDAIEIINKGLFTSDWEVLPEKPHKP